MIKYTEYETCDILEFLNEFIDRLMYNELASDTITEEYILDECETPGMKKLAMPLVGYKIAMTVEGDHRHDGQVVDYTFTFTSPSGEVTELFTSMSLMVGWNYHEDFEIA
jgi:hypothetical protein